MKERKRILMVTCSFPPEPIVAALMSEAIAYRLSEDCDVTVLCPPPTRPLGTVFKERDNKDLPFKIHEVQSYASPIPTIPGRLRESYQFGKEVVRYIDTHSEDIDGIYAYPWPTAAQYMLLNKAAAKHIPVVTHIQDLYPESLLGKMGLPGKIAKPFLVAFDRLNIRHSDRVIAISPQMKSKLMKSRGLEEEKVVMVRNWQDFSHYENVENEYPTRFTMMFVGSVSPSANVPMLIRAFVRADVPGSRLIIAGNGSQKEECIRLAGNYPHAEIEFCDIQPDTTPLIQAKASLLIFGLKKNVAMTATPSKLVAYMYSGKPVIGAVDRNSDSEMILKNSGGGEVVDAEDEEAFAMLMRKYSRMYIEDLKEMGRKGKEFALQHFSKESNLDLIHDTIIKMIEEKRR
ncbi:MAG: glycosyltransferase family 4 protein [Muribaculaceae bacterium]|nr:glycosyltransferase family 4 protein [Muribaculaceae bacterium]